MKVFGVYNKSYDDFISLFPSKGSIYNLMYAINYYHETMFDFMEAIKNENEEEFDISFIRESIKDTINRLITIELLCEENSELLMLYYEKFMDLIGSENISSVLRVFYPEYKRYENREMKRRIRMM